MSSPVIAAVLRWRPWPSGIAITMGAIFLMLSACSSRDGDGNSNLEVPGTLGLEQRQTTETNQEVVAQSRSASARQTATAFAVLDEALANQDLATPTKVPVPTTLPNPTIAAPAPKNTLR